MSEITSRPAGQSSTALTEKGPAAPPEAPTLPARPFDGSTLRLWPALVIIAVMWAVRVVPPMLLPDELFLIILGAVWGPMVAAGALTVWWVFFSRVPWSQAGLGLLGAVGIGAVAWFLTDATMGPMVLLVFALPVVISVWVGYLLLALPLRPSTRFAGLFVVFLFSWGAWDCLWFKGTTGEFEPKFGLRWEMTPERQLLAGGEKPQGTTQQAAALKPGDWPAFRGANRDSVLTGVTIATDWNQNPPKELWRRKVGPGWSSFAVVGDLIYTQEQRGEEELVSCYDVAKGNLIWAHKNPGRFSEAIAGPGPRATPTYLDGKIYAFSANGRLDCLDAVKGTLLWSRDAQAEAGAKLPTWGFAASPLICQGTVSVFVGGPEGKAVVAYDASSGEPAWAAGEGTLGYSSTQAVTLHGVEQLLINTENGTTSIEPRQGKVLWTHDWKLDGGMARVVQPTLVGDNDFLLGTFFGMGTQRVSVEKSGNEWSTKVTWHTKAIKPYYNDMVVHEGHLYGFDGAFFTCLDMKDGKSKWRARGYGNGQVLLLKDQGVLLILSETGEIALVEANPAGHKELGRRDGITGKTWNHPVVANGKLFIRNGEEMACFELTLTR